MADAVHVHVRHVHVHALRRAYELGRLRTSLVRAAVMTAPIAALGWAVNGGASLRSLPVTLLAWALAFFIGGRVQRGAFAGLAGGVITFLLPLSILRPCCAPGAMMTGMTGECCTMPGACLAAGGVVGASLAACVSLRKDQGTGRSESWWRSPLGMGLGVASVAIFKCATLFAGETLGLAAGVMVGLMAATAARARWMPQG